MDRMRDLAKTVGLVLLGCAIGQELAKPPAERNWHGRVAGFIPYDFRAPTLERLREAYWNPDNPRLFTDRVLGIGWGVNLYRIWEWLAATQKGLRSSSER